MATSTAAVSALPGGWQWFAWMLFLHRTLPHSAMQQFPYSFCTALHTSNIQDQPAHVCKYMRKVRRCGEFVVDGCPQERNHWMNVNYLPSKRRQNIGALLFNGDIYRKKVPHGRPGNGIPYPAVEPASREVWRFEEGLRYRCSCLRHSKAPRTAGSVTCREFLLADFLL
ncbi:uncharacterized protein LOC144112593 isoform X1 [Amblyomma americanum]